MIQFKQVVKIFLRGTNVITRAQVIVLRIPFIQLNNGVDKS